jgi:hypothetical protein
MWEGEGESGRRLNISQVFLLSLSLTALFRTLRLGAPEKVCVNVCVCVCVCVRARVCVYEKERITARWNLGRSRVGGLMN